MSRLPFLVALLLLPVPVRAQSLGQAAAQEKERREKVSKEGKAAPARVFTNEDLKGGDGSGKDSGSANASPLLSHPSEASEGGESREGKARVWEQRGAKLRATLGQTKGQQAAVEARISELRQELNPMSTSYVLDPNKFLRIQEEIRKAEAQLESLKPLVQAAQEAWSQFEDDARRAGVPIPAGGESLH